MDDDFGDCSHGAFLFKAAMILQHTQQ
jgi:hypothetical protein